MGTRTSRWIARGRLHQTRTTDPWQHAFREAKEIQGKKSSFVGNWPHDDPLAHLDSYHFLIITRVFLWGEATSERRYENGSDQENPVRTHSVGLGRLRVHLDRENVG